MTLSPRDLLGRMLLMRRFEETVIHAGRTHKLGRQHLAIGQEAVGAPVLAEMRPGDLAYTTHRNHGHMIARGVDPGRALAEILGREGGLCGGKGGTWHMTDPSKGFQSTSAMVGGSIGLSVGGAFALRQAGSSNVSVALFGDGALDEGISYEAMNMASLFSLPVLFLCENNSKEGAQQTSQLAAKEITDVPKALRIECATVDGGDPEAVSAAAELAFSWVRNARAPYFLEARITRWPGSHQIKHEFTTGITDVSAAWDEGQADNEFVEWNKADPILRYIRTLLQRSELTRDDVIALDDQAKKMVEAARAFAEASPYPRPETALTGAFV